MWFRARVNNRSTLVLIDVFGGGNQKSLKTKVEKLQQTIHANMEKFGDVAVVGLILAPGSDFVPNCKTENVHVVSGRYARLHLGSFAQLQDLL